MYPTSNFFKHFLKKTERTFVAKCRVNGVEYTDKTMVSFEIENSLSLSNELELGTAIPNKLTIKFRMLEQFPPNAKIEPLISLSLSDVAWQDADFSWDEAEMSWEGELDEWLPLGTFYVDHRTRENDIWTYTCYDALIFGDQPYVPTVTFPTTMQTFWNDICNQLGYTCGSTVQVGNYPIKEIPEGFSMRQIMMHICAAYSACAFMDKDGILQWLKVGKNDAPVMEMKTSDYMRIKFTNPVKTYTKVIVVVDSETDFTAGEGTPGTTLTVECVFGSQEIADALLTAMDGYSYQPVSMQPRGYPHLDQGDRLEVELENSVAWEEADISWEDADFSWDGLSYHQTIILHQVLTYRGGFSMQIEAPSISEQQSEFVVEGSITKKINQLNRDTVKLDRNYYGFSVSKEQGAVIERSDGLAKAVWNTDEFTFYAENEKALWFDVPNKRFAFKGHIEAASGSFTGEIKASSGNIGGWTINSSGLTGSGTISGGLIQGTTIQGTGIIGAIVTGSLIQTQNPGVYPRVEFTSSQNMIKIQGSSSTWIDVISNPAILGAPYMNFNFASYSTSLRQLNQYFHIQSTTDINIISPNVRIIGGFGLSGATSPLRGIGVAPAMSPDDVMGKLNELISALKAMWVIA